MWKKIGIAFALLIALAGIVGAGGVFYAFHHFNKDLPDYKQLANYEPPMTTRLYASDGRLMEEYATEKRNFVPVEAIPKRVIRAFIAAEDKNFYIHSGADFLGILRALKTNLENYGTDKRLQGASTITQQVAKNFLLTNEQKIKRKIKEIILSFKIEKTFSKDRILELYLNEIYLGMGSYGVAAAAMNYFNKSLDELSISEAAYLGALPKGPSNYHPIRKKKSAIARRNWVIDRMVEERYVTPEEAALAKNDDLVTRKRGETEYVKSDYFAEEVRRELFGRYGDNALYEGGLTVKTTFDPKLQSLAKEALRWGLERYDRRHGWRGPITQFKKMDSWAKQLEKLTPPKGMGSWKLSVVLGVNAKEAIIGFKDGQKGVLPLAHMRWARPWVKNQKVGAAPSKPSQVVKPGDVVLVDPVLDDGKLQTQGQGLIVYGLKQVPDVQGGIVAIDPHTGRVLAMQGGYSADMSVFNRVTQAARQPGSSFKPFVYMAALDNGYTPATLIQDAPFCFNPGPGQEPWCPDNYTKRFYGPTPMRLGIEKSRNLMTVRLAQTIGMDLVAEYAERFGVVKDLPRYLPVSLGAGETTLMEITTAYAMIVNGGKRIEPTLIDRIQDRHGRTIYRHDRRICRGCTPKGFSGQSMPILDDVRAQILNPAVAYQMVSMLRGVVQRGTAARMSKLPWPVAGKTGTTNDNLDTWFVGFSPDLAVGVFVGFDQPRTLGSKETGGSTAAPIFQRFMEGALQETEAVPFRVPDGVRLVYVNRYNGLKALPGEDGAILEPFQPGTEPTRRNQQYIGGTNSAPGDNPYGQQAPAFGQVGGPVGGQQNQAGFNPYTAQNNRPFNPYAVTPQPRMAPTAGPVTSNPYQRPTTYIQSQPPQPNNSPYEPRRPVPTLAPSAGSGGLY